MTEVSWKKVVQILLGFGVSFATIVLAGSLVGRGREIVSTVGFLSLTLAFGYWLIFRYGALTQRRVVPIVAVIATMVSVVALLLRLVLSWQ